MENVTQNETTSHYSDEFTEVVTIRNAYFKNVSQENDTTSKDEQDISTSDVMSVVYFVMSSIGIIGNLFALVVFLSSKALRGKLTNWYLISQSVLDLLVSFFQLLTTATVTGTEVGEGIGAELHCRLWKTEIWQWCFMVNSTYNLVILTIERYMEVVHPIWHKIHIGRNQVIASLVLAWSIGLIYHTSNFASTSKVEEGSCFVYYFPNVTAQKAYGFVTISVQFLIPFLVLVYCYTRIALAIHKRVVKVAVNADVNNTQSKPKNDKWHQARKNTIKTLALVAFFFILCWSWNQIYYLMFNLGYPADFASNFFHFTVIMLFSNAIVNPFIYTFQYSKFQEVAMQLFCKTCKPNVSPEGTSFTQNTTAVPAN